MVDYSITFNSSIKLFLMFLKDHFCACLHNSCNSVTIFFSLYLSSFFHTCKEALFLATSHTFTISLGQMGVFLYNAFQSEKTERRDFEQYFYQYYWKISICIFCIHGSWIKNSIHIWSLLHLLCSVLLQHLSTVWYFLLLSFPTWSFRSAFTIKEFH